MVAKVTLTGLESIQVPKLNWRYRTGYWCQFLFLVRTRTFIYYTCTWLIIDAPTAILSYRFHFCEAKFERKNFNTPTNLQTFKSQLANSLFLYLALLNRDIESPSVTPWDNLPLRRQMP
jgi:hypothetical protein